MRSPVEVEKWLISFYMQRKVHIKNNCIDEYTKFNGRVINITFMVQTLRVILPMKGDNLSCSEVSKRQWHCYPYFKYYDAHLNTTLQF